MNEQTTDNSNAAVQPAVNNVATDQGELNPSNMGMLMDIPVTLSMELGRTRVSIRELMNFKSGSVVELQKMTDEPMDVLVNGTLVARGEAVVIDDRFGIRLTDVVSPMERVKNL